MSKLHLPANPTLANYQKYVADMIVERGFKDESIAELLMLLMEECGELARACRKHTSVKSDAAREEKEMLEHELADILMYTLAIANKFGVDLEKAFRDKEEINKKRIWK
jgi:NTP pyrophosphatase (non-canonical NTP hydrolase)